MEKLTIQIFTDPMMGLSYESEPVFRTLETHYPGMLEFRYRMGLLVRDVMDFIQPLIKEGMLDIREVRRGWFIESRQG